MRDFEERGRAEGDRANGISADGGEGVSAIGTGGAGAEAEGLWRFVRAAADCSQDSFR